VTQSLLLLGQCLSSFFLFLNAYFFLCKTFQNEGFVC
jgi:hypothetical protein